MTTSAPLQVKGQGQGQGQPELAHAFAPAQLFTLGNAAGLEVQVLDYGATWLSCSLPLEGEQGGRRELLLGAGSLAAQKQQVMYLGATIGRFTNRIRGARFEIDGRKVSLAANNGLNQLHGGPFGFDRQVWEVAHQAAGRLDLLLHSPDGDQGYPGNLQARVSYQLDDALGLSIFYEAQCSQACPVGLTSHPYFNLDGDPGGSGKNALGQRLRVAAGHWLPVDPEGLPARSLAPVEGSGLDFRDWRQLREAIVSDSALRAAGGIDHALALDLRCRDHSEPAAELIAADGRVRLRLFTEQPALQVYTGQGLAGALARCGQLYGAYAGLALEPQFLPDSPNHAVELPHWPNCVLRPGQVWRAHTRFSFQVD